MRARLLFPSLAVVACLALPPADQSTVVTSFYTNRLNGHRTTSGERLDNNALTAAHRTYPLGTRLRLTDPRTQKSIVVRVNDRGPFAKGRDLSITREAARQLGLATSAVARLNVQVIGATR